MRMTKDFAICEVHAVTGKHITILNMEEYCTAMCQIDVLHESDDYTELRKIYDEKYDNRYVTDMWHLGIFHNVIYTHKSKQRNNWWSQ